MSYFSRDVGDLNMESLTCQIPQEKYQDLKQEFYKWMQIIQHFEGLYEDIQTLQTIKILLTKAKENINHQENPSVIGQFGEKLLFGVQAMTLAKISADWAIDPLSQIQNQMRLFQLNEGSQARIQLVDVIQDEINILIDEIQHQLDQVIAYPIGSSDLQAKLDEIQLKQNICSKKNVGIDIELDEQKTQEFDCIEHIGESEDDSESIGQRREIESVINDNLQNNDDMIRVKSIEPEGLKQKVDQLELEQSEEQNFRDKKIVFSIFSQQGSSLLSEEQLVLKMKSISSEIVDQSISSEIVDQDNQNQEEDIKYCNQNEESQAEIQSEVIVYEEVCQSDQQQQNILDQNENHAIELSDGSIDVYEVCDDQKIEEQMIEESLCQFDNLLNDDGTQIVVYDPSQPNQLTLNLNINLDADCPIQEEKENQLNQDEICNDVQNEPAYSEEQSIKKYDVKILDEVDENQEICKLEGVEEQQDEQESNYEQWQRDLELKEQQLSEREQALQLKEQQQNNNENDVCEEARKISGQTLPEKKYLMEETIQIVDIFEEQSEQRCVVASKQIQRVSQCETLKDDDNDPSHYSGVNVQRQQVDALNVSISGQSEIMKSQWNGSPVVDQDYLQGLDDISEYGYGMWIRFDTQFPVKTESEPDQYTFISRLTSNEQYEDYQKYGDRTLAIFILNNVFVFTSYDINGQEKNLYKNTITIDKNYEGIWYFVVFSYSNIEHQAVGYIRKYGNYDQLSAKVNINCTHVPPYYFRIIVGGHHMNYDGFNGSISNFFINIGSPAFIQNDDQLLSVIRQSSHQPQSLYAQIKQDILTDIVQLDAGSQGNGQYVTDSEDSAFIFDQYAVSGWFRWVDDINVVDTLPFRLFNLHSTPANQFGNHTLEVHFITQKNAIIFNTYSVLGVGSNCIQSITEPLQFIWTFVYFGYSYNTAQAHAALIQPAYKFEYNFTQIQHHLGSKLHLIIGGDQSVPSFNGHLSYFSLYLGPQSFASDIYFGESFSYGRGASSLYSQSVQLTYKDEKQGEPELIRQMEFDQEQSVYEIYIQHQDHKLRINGLSEYSFGLWAKWDRSSPKFLNKRQRIHSIAHLGTDIFYLDEIVDLPSNYAQSCPPKPLAYLSGEEEESYKYSDQGVQFSDQYVDKSLLIGEEQYGEDILSNDNVHEEPLDLPLDGNYIFAEQHAGQQPNPINKEQALSVRLGLGSFVFSTYTVKPYPRGGISDGVQYEDQLEGQWNYIYFGYKRFGDGGVAQGFVVFSDHVGEVSFNITHDFIINTLHFIVGMENEYTPAFNGYLSRIQVSVGSGSFIPCQQRIIEVCSGTLPSSAMVQPIGRKTFALQNQELFSQCDETAQQYQIQQDNQTTNGSLTFEFENVFDGVLEYSVSGWAKWTGPRITRQQHNLVTLAQKKFEEMNGGQDFGEQSLQISRNDAAYRFTTYTCLNELECVTGDNTSSDQSYGDPDGEYWDQWTFLYFGYSKIQRKVFGYLRYTFTEQQFVLDDIDHYYLSTMTLILTDRIVQTDLSTLGMLEWMGYVKTWVLNVGEGSFRMDPSKWDQDDNPHLNFGIKAGSDHIKLSQASQEVHKTDKILECSSNGTGEPPIHAEFQHGRNVHLQGVSEYGYGYWLRFQYFASENQFYIKPQWLGVSRLCTNKVYEDQDELGDRTLVVLLGRGFYQFATYNMQPPQPNIHGNIKYDPEMEGDWMYVHFSYKRFNQGSGSAVGFTVLGNDVSSTEIEALHYPLQEYMQLLVGSAGHFYPWFNGQITKVRFNLGPGSFIDSKQDIVDRIQQRDPRPYPIAVTPRTIAIIQKKIQLNNAQGEVGFDAPKQYDDYAGAQAYGISLWFRWERSEGLQESLLYRLTTTQPEYFSDQQKPGDRVLALANLPRNHNVQFSTYSLKKGDEINPLVQFDCPIQIKSIESWTFAYFAYSRKSQQVQYYLNAEGQEFRSNEKILHLTPGLFWLYIGTDRSLAQFRGRMAYFNLDIGNYRTNNFISLPSFISGSPQFQSDRKILWDKKSDSLIQIAAEVNDKQTYEFYDNDDLQIEGISAYSVGFWSRYLTNFPQRVYGRPDVMQLVRFGSNKEEELQGQLHQGDRVLGISIGFKQYLFQTYDILTKNNALQTFITTCNDMEGTWRYVYFSYSKDLLQASSFLIDFNDYDLDSSNKKSVIDNILHDPLQDYARLTVGGEPSGFNGYITKLQIRFGSYINDLQIIQSIISTSLSLPLELTTYNYASQPQQNYEIIGEKPQLASEAGRYVLFNVSQKTGGQYSISGWIKYIQPTPKSFIQMRQDVGGIHTINEEEIVQTDQLFISDDIFQVTADDEYQDGEDVDIIRTPHESNQRINIDHSNDSEEQVNNNIGLQFTDQQLQASDYDYYGRRNYVSGVNKQVNSECQIIFRVADNQGEHLNDRATQGDRSLYAEFCGSQRIRFSTYTLIGLSDPNEAKYVEKNIELKDFTHSWIYIYMAYDDVSKSVNCLLKLPKMDDIIFSLTGVQHFVPSQLIVFVGQDAFKPTLNAYIQNWMFSFGLGSFVQLKSDRYTDLLLNYDAIQTDAKFTWNIDENKQFYMDDNSTPIANEFNKEADSVMEYAVGVWARWMTDIPSKLMQKSPIHSVFRLTSEKQYGDKSQMGDRTLSVFIIQGSYQFCTYDIKENNPSVCTTIPYEDHLEGSWNFIYMGYSMKNSSAIGMVLFREISQVESIQLDVQHKVMASFAKIIFAAQEFGYTPFHGSLYDPRVYFGPGAFQEKGQEMIDSILMNHRRPILSPTSSANFAWDVQNIDTSNSQDQATYSDRLYYRFDDRVDINEYGFSVWVQPQVQSNSPNAIVDQLIMRLTTNDPEYQADNCIAGDRTFLILSNPGSQTFATYSYNEPTHDSLVRQFPVNDNEYQWVFMYFGYSKKQQTAFAYSKFISREESDYFGKVQHLIPRVFNLYLIQDTSYTMFYGKMQQVNLNFGNGAYITQPKTLIDIWPYNFNEIKNTSTNSLVNNGQISNLNRGSNQPQIEEKEDQNQIQE